MPVLRNLHTDRPLTNLAVEYGPQVMIADQIFPSLSVRNASDTYYIIDPERNDLKEINDRRGKDGEPPIVDWSVANDNYATREHVLGGIVTYAEIANADDPLTPEKTQVKQILSRLGINKEIEAASLCSSAITQTDAASGTTTGWNAADATPIDDIETQAAAITAATGMVPNTAWCSWNVYRALRRAKQITDNIKSGALTTAMLNQLIAEMIGVDKIIVSRAMKNTSKSKTKSLSTIWGDAFYLGYIDPAPQSKVVTFGLTFDFTGDGINQGYGVYREEDQWKGGVKMQAGRWYDQKVAVAAAAAKITECLG